MKLISYALAATAIISAVMGTASEEPIREEGRCSMYGNCGKKSIFGGQLPCPTNSEATVPEGEQLQLLEKVCGTKFDTVCCSLEQLQAVESNLKRVDPLISSCPACRQNFYDFICEFTCSPNQATFVEITKTALSVDTKQDIVTELTQFVDPKYAEAFYDSCKNVKFSATNGYAMDLIGGGAKDYKQFLKFLGDEKPLLGGSPFQINYDYTNSSIDEGLVPRTGDMKPCDDPDFKCACSDCTQSCPTLPEFRDFSKTCHIGPLPCLSFSVLIIWSAIILGLGAFHVNIARKRRSKLQLSDTDSEETTLLTPIPQPLPIAKTAYFASLQQKFISSVSDVFESTGYYCAAFPGITIGLSLVFTLLSSAGLFNLQLETNPVNLWVSPEEPALKNLEYFESSFGEWFRIEQFIISSKKNEPILDWKNIKWWFEKELELETLNANVSLSDICFKPLGDTCGIQSFTQYFQGNIDYLSEYNWEQSLTSCTNSPVNCLPTFQQPLKKNILFDNDDVLNSRAFTVTVLVDNNSTNKKHTQSAIEYEHSIQSWVETLKSERPDLNIAYSTEVSLTEELNKSTNTDVRIVIISYLCMFFYASLALGGKLPRPSKGLHVLLKTRFSLGLGGIAIILLSISSSAGLFATLGLKSTLVVAEVIPFLVLAVGVDNIFLIVHELRQVTRHSPESPVEARISQTLRNIGPSCLISAALQFSMFLIATRVDMPAVKNFAYYSAGAIFINFLLQMTAFIALLSVDQKRIESGRLDIIPWIQLEEQETSEDEWSLRKFFSDSYAPYILSKTVKPKILTIFLLWTGISLSLFPAIEKGLDQRDALPQDSYLINYFDAVYEHLNVGPPIFFVVKDLDLTVKENQQRICGKFSKCDEFSVANILEQEYKRGNLSTITDPATNWLDDFLGWLNPSLDECCRIKKTSLGGFDAFDQKIEFCAPRTPARQCVPCYQNHSPPYNTTMEGLPTGQEFMDYFHQWIQEPSDPCPLGGKAPYDTSIARTNTNITASYFRAGHHPLRSQQDFISAYQNSLRIVDELKEYNDIDVFAYSPFYVFFVQYTSIVSRTFVLLGAAVLVIFGVSTFMLGWKRALVLGVMVVLVLVDIGGVMAVAGISLNAVSLVNLVICGGLAVEFGVHITKASVTGEEQDSDTDSFDEHVDNEIARGRYVIEGIPGEIRTNAAYRGLTSVGPTTVIGITLTKLIGISVLAFTHSKIFEVYYFRMWLGLVAIAAAHSLVLLPVLLSYI